MLSVVLSYHTKHNYLTRQSGELLIQMELKDQIVIIMIPRLIVLLLKGNSPSLLHSRTPWKVGP